MSGVRRRKTGDNFKLNQYAAAGQRSERKPGRMRRAAAPPLCPRPSRGAANRTYLDVSNFHRGAPVTVYHRANVVRHEVCPGQSGGAAGPEATRRRGTRRAGRGKAGAGRREPPLAERVQALCNTGQKALRPLRPRRASGASASPAERGAPRLRRFDPSHPGEGARSSFRRGSSIERFSFCVFHFSFDSLAGTEDCGGSTGSSTRRRPPSDRVPPRGGFGSPPTTCSIRHPATLAGTAPRGGQ
jgi:hypothetical protein